MGASIIIEKAYSATVLIIDDTPTNLGVVVEALEQHGMRVVVAQDGKEGMQRAAFIKPDLILLDVMMPGMGGFEVCRELKSMIATRDIPVIFMTALADIESKLEGFKAGGVDYIAKPLSIDEMLARVTAHVALRMAQVRLDQQNQKLQHEAVVRQQAESTLQEAYDELKSVYKRLEHAKIQLLSGAKMASIGMLSSGAARQIAHPVSSIKDKLGNLEACLLQPYIKQPDIRQSLDSIATDAESTQASGNATPWTPPNQPAMARFALTQREQRMLQTIDESRKDLAQMDDVVDLLQDLAAPSKPAWRLTNPVQLLDNTLRMFSNELSANVKIVKNYADVAAIACRPAELMQVFMSLLLNAAQAIPETGEIRIATGCGGQEIWIDITDTGIGIEPENLTRIFDPFFSTKPCGKGAGLGLSLSFAFIKKHHGRVEVKSTLGAGSTFRVWLPLQQPVAGEVK